MRPVLLLFTALAALLVVQPVDSIEDEPITRQHLIEIYENLVKKLREGNYSSRGADACLGCHDEEEEFPTIDLFLNVHSHPTLAGSPFHTFAEAHFPEGLQCESCHGPSGDHGKKLLAENELREPMINFGSSANAPAGLQNQLCLSCHDDYNRAHWTNSDHEVSELACADCHRIHSETDPVRHAATQNTVCASCHTQVAWDSKRLSSHPMSNNQLLCRDCHDPHGGGINSSSLIRESSINEVCTSCHQEVTGPFLWEHPPVIENCSTCHEPHGSNNRALLTMDVPQLCQSCHTSVGHRSLRMNLKSDPSDPGGEFLFLNACLNCHSSIHGSNHPSGNLFRR